MLKRWRNSRRRRGGQTARALAAALIAVLLCCACGAPSDLGGGERATPTASPAPTLTLNVVQTIWNEYTGRRTESVFNETVGVGGSYTVQNLSGVWSLTFTVASVENGVVTVRTERPMHPHEDAGKNASQKSFAVPLGAPCRIDEPLMPDMVWYTLTFADPQATPAPMDETLVQFTEKRILSNIRRTLHEGGKSAFTLAERELILFVELAGESVTDIGELSHLPNLEVLTLDNTGVTDLSPLKACERMRTLVLRENPAIDYTTLPALPALRMLSITGNVREGDVAYLRALLPDCGIAIDWEN